MNATRAVALASSFALALLGSGCASRRAPAAPGAATTAPRCEAAFAHADGVLREGLEQIMADMTRYVKVREPDADTSAAMVRARAKANAFSVERRPGFVKECRSWPEERVGCVERSAAPLELSACGEDRLVRAFTDEVVPEFTADPLSRQPPPPPPPETLPGVADETRGPMRR